MQQQLAGVLLLRSAGRVGYGREKGMESQIRHDRDEICVCDANDDEMK
jgi:hypothetical protein